MKHHTAKILTLLFLLTAFIIAFSLFTQHLLRSDSDKLTATIDAVEKRVHDGAWDEAVASLEDTKKIWSGVKATWSALIDHQEIDSIDVTLSRLEMSVKAKEPSDSLSETAALRIYIGHIPQKEGLKLENLL
jgi:hypothetical protein